MLHIVNKSPLQTTTLDAIEACLTEDPKESVDHLVRSALAAGGLDNISVLIADISSQVNIYNTGNQ